METTKTIGAVLIIASAILMQVGAALGWVFGVYLCFTASILMGLIAVFFPPVPFIAAGFYLFYGVNLAAKVVEAVT